jgi:hypothetical protein
VRLSYHAQRLLPGFWPVSLSSVSCEKLPLPKTHAEEVCSCGSEKCALVGLNHSFKVNPSYARSRLKVTKAVNPSYARSRLTKEKPRLWLKDS